MEDRAAKATAHLPLAVVLAAIIVSAGIFASSYSGTTRTKTDTSTVQATLTRTTVVSTTITSVSTMVSPCSSSASQQVWADTGAYASPSSGSVPVLLMDPGSTAYVCVTYQTTWQGNATIFRRVANSTFGLSNLADVIVNSTFLLSLGSDDCTWNSNETSCTRISSNSFRIDAVPNSITPAPQTDNVTVLYVITALSNSTGFYYGPVPIGYCGGTPLAVGYTRAQVNASDFGPFIVLECPVMAYAPISVSVIGMNVTHLQFTNFT